MNSFKSKNDIKELLKTHGKRLQPDENKTEATYNKVAAHWRESVIKRKRQHKLFTMKIAAAIMVVFSGLLVFQLNRYSEQDTFAIKSLYVQGELMYSNDNINWKSNPSITNLHANTWLKTQSNTSANLSLADNSQLRINQNTHLHIINQSAIELISGQIYYDADKADNDSDMIIHTDLGSITHIGTRYLIEKTDTSLQIAVRNGLVELSNATGKQRLKTGNKLEIDQSGILNQGIISAYDPLWDWARQAAEPFKSNNNSLYDFIDWYAHENGLQVNWNEKKLKTRTVKLSGNISNLDTNKQLKTVFLTTTFNYEINQGILSIL